MSLPPGQLINVWLANVRFTDDPTFRRRDQENVRYRVLSDVEIDNFHDSRDGETHAVVAMTAEIEWTREDESSGPVPFELELTLKGSFSFEHAPLDRDLASAWLTYNAPHLLWPYLRAHVSTITGLSRLPTLTIYTVAVPEAFDVDEDEAAAESLPRD